MRYTFLFFILINISFLGNSQIIDKKSITDLKFRHIGLNADFKPADSYYEVYEILHKRLENVGVEYNNLMDSELKAFIQKLNSEGVNTIVLK